MTLEMDQGQGLAKLRKLAAEREQADDRWLLAMEDLEDGVMQHTGRRPTGDGMYQHSRFWTTPVTEYTNVA